MNETKAIANSKSPQIISVSAGKGGAGKTLISVNLARTLSWSGKRVLLVDMDLYNRGSTTLVAEPPITGKITVAGLMEMANDTRITRLRKTIAESDLAETKDDEGNPIPLYLIPSTITNSIVDWAHHTYAIEQLKDFMAKVVLEVAPNTTSIVLFSIAAPDLSHYSLPWRESPPRSSW
jgi:cellulose biosynthesis protein BcsQ